MKTIEDRKKAVFILNLLMRAREYGACMEIDTRPAEVNFVASMLQDERDSAAKK